MFEDSGEVSSSDNQLKVSPLISGTTYRLRIYAVTQSGRGAGVDAVGQTNASESIKMVT